ncbi:MAG TPA: efflux RND transporter periplasmic adaptor subunit [Terracidiphilus sp.]|nr:efflux RND transporter periplasmic adaptor subunit [Terracidiphilus sp.]
MKIILSMSWIAISAAFLSGCHEDAAARLTPVENAAAHLVASRQQQIPVGMRVTGTVQAKEEAIISAQVMGRIEQVLVHEGDNVRPGQTLVILDDAVLQQTAAQAQAALVAAQSQQAVAQSNAALAASTLARYRQLQTERSVSPQEMDEVSRRADAAQAQFDAARAQTQAAQAQSGSARTMLGYSRLVAPFAGIVTARTADPGSMAAPGVPLLQIDHAGPLQLQVSVDESTIAAVRHGMKIDAAVDGIPQSMQGTVAAIVPAADPASHSFLVKIDLPSSAQLRPGLSGSAQFAGGSRVAILVPRSAVVMRGSINCAYVLDGQGIAQLRYLTLGAAQGDRVEVLSGISAGEQLVDSPQDRDFSGKRVTPQNGVQP